MRLIAVIALGTLACGCGHARAERQAVPASGLTIDLLTQIKHPSQPAWSPDSRRVAFVWDVGGVQNLYIVDAAGERPAVAADVVPRRRADATCHGRRMGVRCCSYTPGICGRSRHRAASSRSRCGRRRRPRGTSSFRLTARAPHSCAAAIPVCPTGSGRTAISGCDRSRRGRRRSLTHGEGVVSSPSWSPDGQHLAFALTPVRVVSEAPEYSGAKILYTRREPGPSAPAFVAAAGGKVTRLAPSPGWESVAGVARRLTPAGAARRDDYRTRELSVTDTRSGQTK